MTTLDGSVDDMAVPVEGVYYCREDYAGFLRRMISAGVDLSVLLVVWLLLNVVWVILVPASQAPPRSFFWVWLGIAYLYLAILKQTRIRTLGYIVAGIRVVGLKGDRPSLLAMTCRFLLLALGWLFLVFDIAWLAGDRHRQTLRDKLAGTYVVRTSARPLGTGVQSIVPYFMLGLALLFREVRPAPNTMDGPPSNPGIEG